MIEEDIRAEAKKEKVLPYFIEKEYLQHVFLSQLFGSEGFVLRGGACLRIAYGYERFSRSLELASSLPGEEVKDRIHRALRAMTMVDYSVLSERLHERGYDAMVEFRGPLYHASKNTNLLTISVRFIDPLLEPRKKRVSTSFGVEYVAWAMDVSEILTEKIVSMAARKKPEDAFDAWSILKSGVRLDLSLVEKKASQLGMVFSMPVPPFCDRDEYEKALKNTLASLPPYEEVVRDLEGFLSREKPAEKTGEVPRGAPRKERVEVVVPRRDYRLWLGLVLLLGGLFAVTYIVIQEGQREAFTVLYFSDPVEPVLVDWGNKALYVNFTVENHEYRDIDYLYRVSLRSADEGVLAVREGEVGLGHGENITVSEVLPLNDTRGERLYVELFLNNTGDAYRTIWQKIE